MKTVKFFKVVATAALLFGGGLSNAQAQSTDGNWQETQKTGVLRYGAAVAPPHIIRDPQTGEYSGTSVDLCRKFAHDALGVEVEIVDTSWDNMVAGLQTGRWDLSMALNQNPKRAMAIVFSDPAIQYQVTGVYDRANPKLSNAPVSLADIDQSGAAIILMSGTSADQSLTTLVKNAQILRLPDIDATRLALPSRRSRLFPSKELLLVCAEMQALPMSSR